MDRTRGPVRPSGTANIRSGKVRDAVVAHDEARALAWSDATVDAALLLGPLYHLTERADRVRAFGRGAPRSPSGRRCGGGRDQPLRLRSGRVVPEASPRPGFEAIVERDITEGQHRNPDDIPGWFTTAYFHLPDELVAEASDAGLEQLTLVAVGLATAHLARWLADDRELLLRAIRRIESAPTLLGMSAHLLLTGRARP